MLDLFTQAVDHVVPFPRVRERAIVPARRVTEPAASGAVNRTVERLTAAGQVDDDMRVERAGARDGLDFTWPHDSAAHQHTNKNGRPGETGRPPKPMPSR
jgi:hypothetical protein